MQGKKAVLGVANQKSIGAGSVTGLWNGQTWSAASAGNVTGKSRSGRAIWIFWRAMTPPQRTQSAPQGMAVKGVFTVNGPSLLSFAGLPMLEKPHLPKGSEMTSQL